VNKPNCPHQRKYSADIISRSSLQNSGNRDDVVVWYQLGTCWSGKGGCLLRLTCGFVQIYQFHRWTLLNWERKMFKLLFEMLRCGQPLFDVRLYCGTL